MPDRTSGLEAWLALLQAHAVIGESLERALTERAGISLAEFDALLHVAGADDGRIRMHELAEGMVFSKSGVTRVVDRLERAGLVKRSTCPDDRRVVWAQITPAGKRALAKALPVQDAVLRERLEASVSPADLAVVRRALTSVVRDSGVPLAPCPSLEAPKGRPARAG